jgi:competence protein ComEC
VLDVGQGDAILIQDPSGVSMLVDGGRDPVVLDAALRRHGVREVDLVVVTHGDTDHVGGLVELVAGGRAGLVWIGNTTAVEGPLSDLVEAAGVVGAPVRPVGAGSIAQLGELSIEVLGPERRYKSANDGSVVLLVRAARSLLLPGDVEAVAQADLGPVRADVLVVPHHGSATTDLTWLEATVGLEAVLSYGENRYGHPHPDVVALLDRLGVDTRHTAIDGDVVVPLGRSP